jgi:hypothetical protein
VAEPRANGLPAEPGVAEESIDDTVERQETVALPPLESPPDRNH